MLVKGDPDGNICDHMDDVHENYVGTNDFAV